jgi:hypothetical protein
MSFSFQLLVLSLLRYMQAINKLASTIKTALCRWFIPHDSEFICFLFTQTQVQPDNASTFFSYCTWRAINFPWDFGRSTRFFVCKCYLGSELSSESSINLQVQIEACNIDHSYRFSLLIECAYLPKVLNWIWGMVKTRHLYFRISIGRPLIPSSKSNFRMWTTCRR